MEMEFICVVPASVLQDGKGGSVRREKWNAKFQTATGMVSVKEGSANVNLDSKAWTVVWVRSLPFSSSKTFCCCCCLCS